MTTYLLGTTIYPEGRLPGSDYFEPYEVGDFPNYKAVVNYAKKMADRTLEDIEIYELKHTIQPYTAFQDASNFSTRQAKKDRDEALAREMKGD